MGAGEFVGLTPQGLVRRWDGPGSPVELGPATPEQETLGARCDAIVLSAEERESLRGAPRRGPRRRRGGGGHRRGRRAASLMLPDGRGADLVGPRVSDPADDLGAGDVSRRRSSSSSSGAAPPERAAAFAAAAAAVRLEGTGPQAIGDRAAIEERLAGSASSWLAGRPGRRPARVRACLEADAPLSGPPRRAASSRLPATGGRHAGDSGPRSGLGDPARSGPVNTSPERNTLRSARGELLLGEAGRWTTAATCCPSSSAPRS